MVLVVSLTIETELVTALDTKRVTGN
ncbi:kinetoplast DNA-associated protein, putative [Trypanosoma brucei gambiense DAL972]|uniref:Kinetoplast DNA-associated protein, putative n=1 Tax=Trypanosoma brucei gambiense (strain MHOM/CI/86/DAL972) TaxID=679716 RepID=D0A411_TRYB9|nr:kinetoplast DNA-associated protein, putative [Trypanosoma brucei gambiense DAL972]CBH16005.1 kinetoplast DNA-associated protein, putative [Trypanosoma brucei gambiense DAL972]|eukprot:XP_011778269.1 kinetoplast DNA-associated protein, putative [Trypanosoma brucei gambiense DAL972]